MKRHLFVPLALLVAACSASEDNNSSNAANTSDDVCTAHLSAADDQGGFCDTSDDCASVDCPCDDGSSVSTRSCFNGSCEGRDACAATCLDFGTSYACAGGANNTNPSNTNPSNTNPNNTNSNNTNPNSSTTCVDTGCADGEYCDGSTLTCRIPIATGERCPQIGCTPAIRPAKTECDGCEGEYCFVPDGGPSYCTIECSEASDCPASFDEIVQRRCVAGVCVKG